MNYIPAEKLIAEIKRQQRKLLVLSCTTKQADIRRDCALQNGVYEHILNFITSLQQEQPDNMIQWTGNNLKEVIDFTGKSPRFGEWFKSWDEYENYVHTHNDILKLFCEDGSHYEVPIGAWIVKTSDGHNVPSVAKYIPQEQPAVELEKEIISTCKEYRITEHSDAELGPLDIENIACYFYELGLNARKEERK